MVKIHFLQKVLKKWSSFWKKNIFFSITGGGGGVLYTQWSPTKVIKIPFKGRLKKKFMENSIKGPDPPPVMEEKNYFFLKLEHFLRTFWKKCIFTLENQKKEFFQNSVCKEPKPKNNWNFTKK